MKKKIRVLLVGHYFGSGGAGRALARIYRALQLVENETGVVVEVAALRGDFRGEPRVFRLRLRPKTLWFWLRVFVRRVLSGRVLRQRQTGLRSNPAVASPLLKMIEDKKFDVINLHWLGDATLSIEQVGQLSAPLVWTLHDMWPYSGEEHVREVMPDQTVDFATRGSRPLDRAQSVKVLQRKTSFWKDRSRVVAPSAWSAKNVAESSLFGNAHIHEIPPPIDLDFWSPAAPGERRNQRDNRTSKRVAIPMFKPYPGWVKGAHLVPKIAEQLEENYRSFGLEIWLFGGGGRRLGRNSSPAGLRWLGRLDDRSLRDLYRQVDVVAVPSLNETFGLVAQESQACGTPVVGFRDTGIESIVLSGSTGLLVEHGSVSSFGEAIMSLLDCPPSESSARARRSRERAETLWSMERIGTLYADVLREQALSQSPGN